MTAPYHGWTNYETWTTDLWLTNDPDDPICALFDEGTTEDELRNLLEEHLLDAIDRRARYHGLAADLLMHALSNVNTTELLQSLRETLLATEPAR